MGLVGVFSAVCLIALSRTPQLVAFSTEAPGVRVDNRDWRPLSSERQSWRRRSHRQLKFKRRAKPSGR